MRKLNALDAAVSSGGCCEATIRRSWCHLVVSQKALVGEQSRVRAVTLRNYTWEAVSDYGEGVGNWCRCCQYLARWGNGPGQECNRAGNKEAMKTQTASYASISPSPQTWENTVLPTSSESSKHSMRDLRRPHTGRNFHQVATAPQQALLETPLEPKTSKMTKIQPWSISIPGGNFLTPVNGTLTTPKVLHFHYPGVGKFNDGSGKAERPSGFPSWLTYNLRRA